MGKWGGGLEFVMQRLMYILRLSECFLTSFPVYTTVPFILQHHLYYHKTPLNTLVNCTNVLSESPDAVSLAANHRPLALESPRNGENGSNVFAYFHC